MASPRLCDPGTQEAAFKTALVDVTKHLTENDCKELAYECAGITRAERDKINDGVQLADKLEAVEFVSMDNVEDFEKLLRRRNFIEAARVLEDYRTTFPKRVSQSRATETDSRDDTEIDTIVSTSAMETKEPSLGSSSQDNRGPRKTTCDGHPRYELDRHCKQCMKVVCIECAFQEHRNCNVVTLTDISNAISEQKKTLTEAFEFAKKQHEDVNSLIAERISTQREQRALVREVIESNAAKAISKVKAEKERLLAIVNDDADNQKDSGFGKCPSGDHLEIMRLNAEKILEDSDQDISTLSEIMKNIESLDAWSNSMRAIKERLEDPNVDLSSRIIENDQRFCEVTEGKVVGGVMVKPDQCIHIIDQRLRKENILLRCFNPKDPNKDYWTHNYNLAHEPVPVVMSHRAMYYNNHFHIIFAVGKKVYVVDFSSTDGLYDSVKGIQPLTVKVVAESSWISSIYAHHSTKANGSEFLLAVSHSMVLHKCDVSKGAFGTIDISSIVKSPPVSCVAYSDNTYAIIAKGDVILFTADGSIRRIDPLKPPEYSSTSLALSVFWTGARWLVLWVDGQARREWNVVMYKPNQGRVEQVHHGTAFTGMDIPVSITNTERDGFISLANNTVSAFKF